MLWYHLNTTAGRQKRCKVHQVSYVYAVSLKEGTSISPTALLEMTANHSTNKETNF